MSNRYYTSRLDIRVDKNDYFTMYTMFKNPSTGELTAYRGLPGGYSLKTDSENILLNIPNIDRLTKLEMLSITSKSNDKRYSVNTEGFCTLTNLTDLRIENVDIHVADPRCIALPSLRTVKISDSDFLISPDLPYSNILEMFAEYSPNLVSIEITGTNMEGEVPITLSNLQDLDYVDIQDNPNLNTATIDNTDLPYIVVI